MKLLKSFIRWSATLGLVGSTVLGSWFLTTQRVLALPTEEVLQKLNQVPVFIIADSEGSPLVAKSDQGVLTRIFIGQEDAEAFLEQLKSQKPELANKVRIVVVPLGEVYKQARENEDKEEKLVFQLVPLEEQVTSAETIWKNRNPDQEAFRGVPLFVATVNQNNQTGYLVYERGEDRIIPLFFEKESLENLVSKYKEANQNNNVDVQINVVSLEGMISTFQNQENEALRQMILVPSEESRELVQQALQQQRSGQN